MERVRIPYTQSEHSNSSMHQHNPPQPRAEPLNSKMGVELKSNKLAELYAKDLDRPTPIWQHYYQWFKILALSAYHTLRVRTPALFIWIALNIRNVALEPTFLHVLTHGCLLALFSGISFSTIDHLDEDAELWFLSLWACLLCFEFLLSIYTFQSLCRRLIRKIRAGDDVPSHTLWVCLSWFTRSALIVAHKIFANIGTNSFNTCWSRRHGRTSLFLYLPFTFGLYSSDIWTYTPRYFHHLVATVRKLIRVASDPLRCA